MSGLIWEQTVCKSYKQTILAGKELHWEISENLQCKTPTANLNYFLVGKIKMKFKIMEFHFQTDISKQEAAYTVPLCILGNFSCFLLAADFLIFCKYSKVLNTCLYLFSNKLLTIKAGTHKMLVRIPNSCREGPLIQLLSSEAV